MNFFKIESYRKGIAISSTFNLAGKIIGFINSLIVASYFGTQGKTDVYVYSLATISLVSGFLTNLNSLVLIPESMRIREQEGALKSMFFLNWFIFSFMTIGIITSFILLIDPVKSFYVLSKFDYSLLKNNVKILYFMIPMFALSVLSALLTEILVSFKYFTLPMIAGMINNIITIIFVVIFHSRLDILSMTAGLLIGCTLNILILLYFLKRQLNWNFSIVRIKIKKLVYQNILFAQANNIVTILGSYLPMYLISGFNSGTITALNYSKNLINIPDQLFTSQFSSIFGIKFNEIFATKNMKKANEIFLSSVSILFFILIPVGLIMAFFSDEIVTILYMRGKFDKISVDLTSEFLRYMAMTLPLLAISTLFFRVITAGQKIKINFYTGVALNIIYLLMLFIFIKKLGPKGYPISLLVFLIIRVFIVNNIIFKKCFEHIKYQLVFFQYIKTMIFFVIIGIPFAVCYEYMLLYLSPLISLSIICILYVFACFFINKIIKLNKDIIIFQNQIISKIKISWL